MKAYSVVTYYYDNCNVWDSIDSYYFSEDKALEQMMTIQLQYEYERLNPDNHWVGVVEIEISEDN